MGKTKILKGPKSSLKKSKKIVLHPFDVRDSKFLDPEIIKSILLEALMEGDMEMLKDAVVGLIRLNKKSDLIKKTKLGRQTLYDLINDKREFNPTVKTLSALLQVVAA